MNQHQLAREFFYRARQDERARRTLGRRIDIALHEAVCLSEVGSPPLERQSKSAEDQGKASPKDGRGLLTSDERSTAFDLYRAKILVVIEQLEAEVDAHKLGRGLVGQMDESTEGRDKRLLKYVSQGLSVQDIAGLDPGQGGVKAIRRALVRLKDV